MTTKRFELYLKKKTWQQNEYNMYVVVLYIKKIEAVKLKLSRTYTWNPYKSQCKTGDMQARLSVTIKCSLNRTKSY